jgi:hypothetical protein
MVKLVEVPIHQPINKKHLTAQDILTNWWRDGETGAYRLDNE